MNLPQAPLPINRILEPILWLAPSYSQHRDTFFVENPISVVNVSDAPDVGHLEISQQPMCCQIEAGGQPTSEQRSQSRQAFRLRYIPTSRPAVNHLHGAVSSMSSFLKSRKSRPLHEAIGWDEGGHTTRPVDLALLNFSLVQKVSGDMIPRSDYR